MSNTAQILASLEKRIVALEAAHTSRMGPQGGRGEQGAPGQRGQEGQKGDQGPQGLKGEEGSRVLRVRTASRTCPARRAMWAR